MRAQLRLLEYLVHMWDVDQQVFHVGAHVLSLDIEDIYFLMGLSRRGSHVTLTGGRGGGLPMSEYLRRYCDPEAERRKGKVSIRGVRIYPSGLFFLPLHVWQGVHLLTWPSKSIFNMQWSAWNLGCSTGATESFAA
jgi:hypothetical protein